MATMATPFANPCENHPMRLFRFLGLGLDRWNSAKRSSGIVEVGFQLDPQLGKPCCLAARQSLALAAQWCATAGEDLTASVEFAAIGSMFEERKSPNKLEWIDAQINFCSMLRTSLRVPKAPAGTGDVFHAQMMLPPLGSSGAGPAGWTGDGYGGC